MSYKSYAQGGQFNTYSIDLPIKAEINEDLRAASSFAEQMELSQKYREKWASSYLTALNEKSSIERQNRDDNFEFLQNNFKRIYEGEQREFEGRLGELRREQHEAADAEPGFIEKLIPMLIELAPKALAVVGQIQTAEIEATNKWSQGITDTLDQNGHSMSPAMLESMGNIARKKPELAEQMFRSLAEKTGVGWQDLQRYTMLSGETQAFRNINAGLNHLGKAEHLIKQQLLPGGHLNPAAYASNTLEYRKTYKKAIADAKRHVFGDYQFSDKTKIEYLSKWEASLNDHIERKAFNTWEGQAKEADKEFLQNKANAVFALPQDQVGPGMFQKLQEQRDYYKGRGFPSKEAHESAFGDVMDWFTSKGSLANVEDIEAFYSTFHSSRNKHLTNVGQAPLRKDIGWSYETYIKAKNVLIERSFEVTTLATRTKQNEEQKIWNNIQSTLNAMPDGAEKRNAITAVQKEMEESGRIFSRDFQTKVLGLTVSAAKPPTFAQKFGHTQNSLEKTANRLLVSKLTGTGSPFNSGKSDAYLKNLQETQSAMYEVVGNAQANWSKYAGEFPHITNPEALRHAILTKSYQDLMDAGEIGLENVNADGTAKDPAKPVTFKKIGGNNPTGMTTTDFKDIAHQEGDKFFKTFTSLTPRDDSLYHRYAGIRGGMSKDAVPDYQDMQMMANTPRMQALREVFPNKTIYELMDLELKSLGLEGLRNIPLTQAQVVNNSAIAERLLNPPPGNVLTQQAYELKRNNGAFVARNKSPEVLQWRRDLPNGKLQANHLTSITGTNGASIQVHSSVQPHLTQMQADAKAAGVNLSYVSGYRSYADQEYLYRTKPAGIAAKPGTSDHGWGMAIDLDRYSGNWEKTYSWLIKNMAKYGFAMIGPDRGYGPLGKPGGVWSDESWHLAFTGRFDRGNQ
jgi:hypothetical protein